MNTMRTRLDRDLVVAMFACIVLGLLQLGFSLANYIEGRLRTDYSVDWNNADSVTIWAHERLLYMFLYRLTPLSGAFFLLVGFIIWNYRRKKRILRDSAEGDVPMSVRGSGQIRD